MKEKKIKISVNEEDVQNIINCYEKDIEYIKKLEKENEELKKQVIIMEKYLELITDLALDYDGCHTTKSLKELINELKRLACLGRVCNITETIYANNNKAYNILHQELEKGED